MLGTLGLRMEPATSNCLRVRAGHATKTNHVNSDHMVSEHLGTEFNHIGNQSINHAYTMEPQ